MSSTGNATYGNILTAGQVSATGNITGSIVTATGAFMVMPVGTSDPLNPVTGAFYYNSIGAGNIRVYTGTAWVSK
jgi:hypothetical protein